MVMIIKQLLSFVENKLLSTLQNISFDNLIVTVASNIYKKTQKLQP